MFFYNIFIKLIIVAVTYCTHKDFFRMNAVIFVRSIPLLIARRLIKGKVVTCY